ncbi:deoxyribose-phosphate aldolase [uncultured Phycicoccus sp.]|uniref:Cgl0159 family (beta/alpha)8-fold protein n=1 Tax=uncultured Phycicoccus sp. TaxID=661422 RepID=UPI00261A652E|nr:deoxyribose-phosphate aldolase [uncultured Phycicoccus sp.]
MAEHDHAVSAADYRALVDARVREPGRLARALADRRRRPLVGEDGRMLLLAADHTSRGKLAIGSDPMAAADRHSLLDRLVTGLADPRVDGVLGSADVLEELALLGALDGRLAVGTMNRGGIAGAHWELDDRVTAYDVEHVVSLGLDGGKTLLRIAPTDPGVPRTLETVARITTALADAGVMALVEPLPYRARADGGVELDPSEDALVRMVAIASGLGSSSAYTWLKIPATVDPARVAAATTCPILLLGGDAGRDHEQVFSGWELALRVPNIRGLVPGRALLYPEVLTVRDAVDRAGALVHPAAHQTTPSLEEPLP